jgi:hypothetical protein
VQACWQRGKDESRAVCNTCFVKTTEDVVRCDKGVESVSTGGSSYERIVLVLSMYCRTKG